MSDAVVVITEEVASVIVEEEGEALATIEIPPQIVTATVSVPGPAGPPGDQGESGPPGDQYPHDQPVASDVWVINHNLGYWPIVRAFDRSGREIKGATVNLTIYTLEIHHKFLQAGYALLK
jgi:hypothetical protein